MSKEHKDMMAQLCDIFPENFVIVGQEAIPAAQRKFALNTTTPLFKIDPILTGTWLDPPKSAEDSSIGLWPEHIVAPKGINPYLKDFVLKPPATPSATFIMDPNLKKLLTASKIKNANLDPTVFRTNDMVKLAGTAFTNVDYFMRNSLFDSLYTEELLGCALGFIPLLNAELRGKFPDLDNSALEFLEKLLCLVSLSNQRSYHGQIASIVANKAGMRNYVFNKFQVPAVTSKTLKGTDFACEGVFGDLPESFLTKFSSVTGNNLICRQKSNFYNKSLSSDSSYQGKRCSPAASQQYDNNKKQKTGVTSN